MSDKKRTAAALLCIAVITFCGITICDHVGRFLRVDLTENKLYTLSDGTRTVLEELRRPLEMKLYYARTAAMKGPETIRAYNNYFFYIRDLLQEYESLSKGKLKLSVIDPRPDSDDELDAVRYGLKRFSAGDESFFFGLAVVSEYGRETTVPFFAPNRQPLVEYEISSAIYNAATPAKKRIGILSSLPVFGGGLSPYMAEMMRMQGRDVPEEWNMIGQLNRFYDVVPVKDDGGNVEDVDLLMIVHPKGLSNSLLAAVDDHVMKGGRLVVFVDPYCVVDPEKDHAKRTSDLNRLLEKWGCRLQPNAFAADRSLGLEVQLGPNEPAERLATFMDLRGESFNRDDVVTARLEAVRVLFGGVLEPTDVPGVHFEPIIATSPSGNVVKASPKDVVVFSNPDMLKRILEDGEEPVVLGCKLTGKFKSALSKAMPEDGATESAEERGDSNETSPETTIVVFADVDMLNDFVAFQDTFFGVAPLGDNMNLLLNVMENLGGAQALSTARTKEKFTRPFKVFERIEKEAEAATAEKVAAVEAEMAKYQEELQSLGKQPGGDEGVVMQGDAIEKRRQLEEQLLMAQRELRKLNRDKRLRIESLTSTIKFYNTLAAPFVILLVALVVFFVRRYKKNKYLGVRHE
ncbi:MAG TPA: hypothetical protein ENN35_08255 [Deltaproteobacteria bacterium]|nr:hypothetical protein [Deltaproteobacteria bacterium]